MPLSRDAVLNRTDTFLRDIDRAHELYERIVRRGYVEDEANPQCASRLIQPDRRDATQFIFFEIAAKYEAVARDLFMIEVRIRIVDSPKRAEFVMGGSDRGFQSVGGWGSPKQTQKRGENLFGKVGFFARLKMHLGETDFNTLVSAHTVRNHIAHSGTKQYRGALSSLGVPRRSRSGCGPGRLLCEYPVRAGQDDRWFHRFLVAYNNFAAEAQRKLVVP